MSTLFSMIKSELTNGSIMSNSKNTMYHIDLVGSYVRPTAMESFKWGNLKTLAFQVFCLLTHHHNWYKVECSLLSRKVGHRRPIPVPVDRVKD